MNGDFMSESGLANRSSCGVLSAQGVADAIGYGGEVWLGGGSEYGGWEDGDRDRRDLVGRVSPLLF